MNRNFLFLAIVLSCSLVYGMHGRVETLRAGFAAAEITPRRPTPMAGYYHERLSTETHDPLMAKATVLSDGQTLVALVALDLISTTRWMVEESRKLIEAEVGIPGDHVLISASHSHTGPVLANRNSSRYEVFGGSSDSAKLFMAELPQRITAVVAQAFGDLREVEVRYGLGSEEQLAFNRRFFMRDGRVGWNPGKLNPLILREAGPTDPQLPMTAFFRENRPVALHVNFAIHLDIVGGTQWSADAPYWLERTLRPVLGETCHVQYTTGCCGDVNHIDVRRTFPQKGHSESARVGIRLAAAVLRQWNDLEPLGKSIDKSGESETAAEQQPSDRHFKLKVSHRMVRLECAPHDVKRVVWAEEVAARSTKDPRPPFLEMVEAFRVLDIEARDHRPFEVEVQVITLGKELAWVSLPGEIFTQLGLTIKQGSPFRCMHIAELANGSIGYIPTEQAYAQGNYEVISAQCAAGSGERLVAAALEQLRHHFED